ncbi:hypothetical protein [Vibrio aestuarianus]|uniref:hypothetical protein n=1 Tax=Vibrio aestuarianus TaxID=28171 RepID=UPI00237C8BC8|nr:hypothetical protein [Vibrio aestuarianus]MDE1334019.1 hypothetical protein [Vibrio aestuarianus]
MENNQRVQSLMDDLDRVCFSLIEAYGLKFSQTEGHLSSPLMRWLDFVSRYIPEFERQIVLSKELAAKLEMELPKQVNEQFASFARRSIAGLDLNPFQSKGLILHNDISDRKKQKRTDLLFADWGILHFHLSDEIEPERYFSSRSDWILFALVYGNVIFCIDILPHSEKDIFSRKAMVEIIYNNWPNLLRGYELEGIVSGKDWSDSEVGELRKAGVSSSYSIDGKVIIPRGLGLTSAAVPLSNINMVQNVIHGVRCLAEIIEDENSEFSPVGDPPHNFELSLTTQGLALYDNNNDVAYKLTHANQNNYALNLLCELVAPEWAWKKEN